MVLFKFNSHPLMSVIFIMIVFDKNPKFVYFLIPSNIETMVQWLNTIGFIFIALSLPSVDVFLQSTGLVTPPIATIINYGMAILGAIVIVINSLASGAPVNSVRRKPGFSLADARRRGRTLARAGARAGAEYMPVPDIPILTKDRKSVITMPVGSNKTFLPASLGAIMTSTFTKAGAKSRTRDPNLPVVRRQTGRVDLIRPPV